MGYYDVGVVEETVEVGDYYGERNSVYVYEVVVVFL